MTDSQPPVFRPGDDVLVLARQWADHLRPGMIVGTAPSPRAQLSILLRLMARAEAWESVGSFCQYHPASSFCGDCDHCDARDIVAEADRENP